MLSEVFLTSTARTYQALLAVGAAVLAGGVAFVNAFEPARAGAAGLRACWTRFSSFLTVWCASAPRWRCCSSAGFLKHRNAERGEFYALMLFAAAGMSLLGDVGRVHHPLRQPRGALGRHLRAHRVPAPRARGRRRRASSTSSSAPSRRRCCSTARRCSTAPPAPPSCAEMGALAGAGGADPARPGLLRLRPGAGRLRLQGGGGALPHVDARRLRGRPHPGDGADERGGEGGRLRRAGARVPRARPRRRPEAAFLRLQHAGAAHHGGAATCSRCPSAT